MSMASGKWARYARFLLVDVEHKFFLLAESFMDLIRSHTLTPCIHIHSCCIESKQIGKMARTTAVAVTQKSVDDDGAR